MGLSWNFCASAAAIAKAGANVNTSIIIDVPILDEWSKQAEGSINAETRKDWVTNPPTLQFSGALAEVESSVVANKIIGYDPAGYGLATAQTIMDLNRDTARINIAFLKDEENKEVMI